MKDIAIYGAGGFGKEVLSLIKAINQKELMYNFIGFFDDGFQKGTKTKYGEILGNIKDLNRVNIPLSLVISIGGPNIIRNIVNSISSNKIEFVNLIHPSTEVHESVKMGQGNIFTFGNFVSCDVVIGDFNIFNTKCGVGHDVCIGSFNVFNPNSQISGSVIIGNENLWGMNSSIMQGKKVGSNNKIGASSFVMSNIKDNESLFGIPAKKLPVPTITNS